MLTGSNCLNVRLESAGAAEVLELYVQFEQDKIHAAKFKAYGSVALLAGADFVCDWLIGKTREQALTITPQMILAQLDLADFKLHTASLLCKAVREIFPSFEKGGEN